jgi:hypothetical protein
MRATWDAYKKNTSKLTELAKNNKNAEATKLLEQSNSGLCVDDIEAQPRSR